MSIEAILVSLVTNTDSMKVLGIVYTTVFIYLSRFSVRPSYCCFGILIYFVFVGTVSLLSYYLLFHRRCEFVVALLRGIVIVEVTVFIVFPFLDSRITRLRSIMHDLQFSGKEFYQDFVPLRLFATNSYQAQSPPSVRFLVSPDSRSSCVISRSEIYLVRK